MEQEKVACVWREEETEDVHSSAYDKPLDTLDMSLDTLARDLFWNPNSNPYNV